MTQGSRCLLLLAIAAATMAPEGTAAPAADDRTSFVLCMADDQGWGDTGYNGHPDLRTPVLDEMAASGLRFDRFYAAAPVCSPTRGSVLTGRHPNRFGCFKWGHTLRPQEVTVAEALREAGYATGHFGKWHLGSLQAGSPVSPGGSGFETWLSSPNFYENDPLMSREGTVVETDGESSMVPVEAALDFIEEAAGEGRPFLAVVWFGNPHTPHVARPELRDLYADHPGKLQNYYGEISGIDRAMGRLRRGLRELGGAENTLLWYTSDNGARSSGSNGHLRGHKGQLWEGGIRVPGIIEWPAAIPEARRTALPCSTVDIYPTLLEVAGLEAPGEPHPLDGTSLVPLIEGRMETRPPLGFWEFPERGRSMRSTRILRRLREAQAAGEAEEPPGPETFAPSTEYPPDHRPGPAAWIDGRYKLHRRPRDSGEAAYLLYDLVEDPRERHDLSGEAAHRERLGDMKAALARWQRSVIGSLNGEDYAEEGSDRQR